MDFPVLHSLPDGAALFFDVRAGGKLAAAQIIAEFWKTVRQVFFFNQLIPCLLYTSRCV